MTIASKSATTAIRSIVSSSSKKPSIGIIGAGIGGLTTAHALMKRGFENVKVYEQADKFYPTAGAGFGLGPNGQMCLLSLGMERKQCEGEFIMFCVGGEDKKTLIWANTYPSDGPPAKTEEWDDILGKQQETLKLLATLLQDNFPSHHPIHELYKHTTPDNLLHFGMSYRPHKKEWYKGRVCLLGDACHATLPYIGQGANMALEDAVVLAECLDVESPNYLAAYELYFQRRHLRTKRIVNYGSVMGTLYHTKNPILEWIRELILKSVLTGGVVKNQLVKDIVEECPVDHAQFRNDF